MISKKKRNHMYLLKAVVLPAIYNAPNISIIRAITIPTLANIQKHPAKTS